MKMKFKIQMKLSIIRQYEVEADNENEARDKASELSCKDMPNCDEYEFLDITIDD